MAELELRMTGPSIGLLRRFRVSLDGVEVARLKQGELARLTVVAGHHHLAAEVDWHSGEQVSLELSDDRLTRVDIEYAWLFTDSFFKPRRPFKYTVSKR